MYPDGNGLGVFFLPSSETSEIKMVFSSKPASLLGTKTVVRLCKQLFRLPFLVTIIGPLYALLSLLQAYSDYSFEELRLFAPKVEK